ncbi:MAG: hypothetical protein JWM11_7677 [Planctomycetaceae bacterium]|nr:hypothetical protein [Planctomycetaceae bacterium]
MRSIPVALIWELLYCGRWTLLLGVVGAPVLPLLLLTALSAQGPIDPNDPAFITIHICLIQINMLSFGAAIMTAQRLPARLATYPISTPTIVTWYALPAMGLMILQTYCSTYFLNVLFHLNWPLWGPSLFAAVAMIAVQAVLWQSDHPLWISAGFAVVSPIGALWFKSRYGALFSQPDHLWSELTTPEILTMLAFVIIAYYFANQGLARKRRGDSITSLGILAWIERRFERVLEIDMPFKSTLAAQSWYDWQTKGWPLPASAVLTMFMGLTGWLIFSRDPRQLVTGCLGIGGLLSALGLIGGLIAGTMGPQDGNFEMGHFLSTRPLTSSDMARMILKTMLKSVLLTWMIWIVALVMVCGFAVATQTMPPLSEMRYLRWWYLPATLFGPWIIVAIGAASGLTGRIHLFVALLMVGVTSFVGVEQWSRYTLSPAARDQLAQVATAVGGVACVIVAAWVFIAAWRRSLIGIRELSIPTLTWFVLSLFVIVQWNAYHADPLSTTILIIGLLALAAAPVAAAPLGIAWNRNR